MQTFFETLVAIGYFGAALFILFVTVFFIGAFRNSANDCPKHLREDNDL